MANNDNRPKSKIDLRDLLALDAVAASIARVRHPDVGAKACKSDARTVMSAWVIGQSERKAAQRLLSWYCIDCGMEPQCLDNAAATVVDGVTKSAKAGYAALEAIERYGNAHLD